MKMKQQLLYSLITCFYATVITLSSSHNLAFSADKRNVSVDDYFTLSQITQAAISPDGKWIAYSEARWDQADEGRKSDLWIIDFEGNNKPRRLTFDRANDRAIKWHDGQIYFLGNHKRGEEKKAPYDGSTQLWRINPIGSYELFPVTKIDGGIAGYDIDKKADSIVYQVDKSVPENDDFSKLRSTYKAEYGHGSKKISELHKLDLNSWKAEKIYDVGRFIREFSVSHSGTQIALISAYDDSVIRSEGESRVDILEGGFVSTPPIDSYRKKAASPHAWLQDLAWSLDDQKFAFCAVFDGYPAEIVVGEKASEWSTRILPRPDNIHVRGYGSPIKWHSSGLPNVIVETNGQTVIAPFTEEKLKQIPTSNKPGSENADKLDIVVYGFDFDEKGEKGVLIKASKSQMGELYATSWREGGEQKKLFELNPQTMNWKLPTVKHVTWRAKDGSTVGGVLELPWDYDGKSKLPLVVAIHGGPTTSTKSAMEYDPHNGRLYFAAHGYAVLLPNYRGSTGYGDTHTTDLLGRENDLDVSDIVEGVQQLIRKGIADPDRVASMGWSNGGYLTNCLITQKQLPFKLKAASSGAGIVDTVLEWGTNDEPAYAKVFKKGHPWETPEFYKKSSPTYGLGNVKTPTLIHVGGNDDRCPPGNSRMLYRALKEYVNVPTELVVYPGEPHGLTKKTHRKAKMEWDLAWFEKYLKN